LFLEKYFNSNLKHLRHCHFYTIAFYLFLVNILGMLIARHLEISARRDFYLDYQLAQEQAKVLELNSSLEQKVAERTHELERSNVKLKNKITELNDSDSERLKLESQLRQAQKMEAIGTLASGIAHDFNNILSSVVGYSDLLLLDIPEGNGQRKYLEQILKAGNRAKDLVKQILMFSRQTDQKIMPLKIHHVLKEVIKLSRSTLPTTTQIKQDIPEDIGTVMADPTQVHQIVMNLVTNAFHAMAETGGTLTIDLEDVDLSADNLPEPGLAAGPYVCLTIADTGTGMDDEIRKKIFEPYFTTKERDKGTGLGLAVVHGIITSYKGTIVVDSEPGKRTAFKVYIPRIVSEIEDRDEIEPTPSMTGDERVLLVDDEKPIAMIIKTILERVGYKVTARNSSTDTLAAFKSSPHKFALVITDMTMPNMTGDKLAIEIKKFDPISPSFCARVSAKRSMRPNPL